MPDAPAFGLTTDISYAEVLSVKPYIFVIPYKHLPLQEDSDIWQLYFKGLLKENIEIYFDFLDYYLFLGNNVEYNNAVCYHYVYKIQYRTFAKGVINIKMLEAYIHTSDNNIRCRTEHTETIADILEKNGFFLSKPCGGNGKCGKCAVRAEGSLSPLTAEEQRLRSSGLLHSNERLACCAAITGEAHIYLDTACSNFSVQSVTRGKMPEFIKDAPEALKEGYGIAVDIGTTTVAAYLYHFPDGIQERSLCYPNPQAAFGGDVISRIEYANSGGLKDLQEKICGLLKQIIGEFGKPPKKLVITGNTTMLHLLTGLDPASIAVAPFRPASLFGIRKGKVYIPPCISAYVGADITCAVLASAMTEKSCSLLVDIGTNGEIAFWDGKRLMCCSAAAGPVFEGAGISQGMIAANGAISKVQYINGEYIYETVGGRAPLGVCGTGLIDMIACMLQSGALENTGFTAQDTEIGSSGIFIRREDVRGVQLAKAAIRAGIETLLRKSGRKAEDIEAFYLCGGFGSYLNYESCAAIGMVPPGLSERVQVIGNASGTGAAMILQSDSCRIQAEKTAREAESTELSADPLFMELYCDNMMF